MNISLYVYLISRIQKAEARQKNEAQGASNPSSNSVLSHQLRKEKKTMSLPTYIILSTIALIFAVTALLSAALLEFEMTLLFFKLFSGLVAFIGIYALLEDADRISAQE